MENSILRNIKNISRIALYTISIGIAAMIAITLFQVLLDGDDMYEYIKDNLQFYYMYICIFSVFLFNLRLSMTDAPIILSFCSRRKDYLTGKYAVNAVIIATLLVINLCIDIYKGGDRFNSMIFMVSSLAALFGVMNILGIVITKYGVIGYMIFIFGFGFFGGIIAFLLKDSIIGEVDILANLRSMRVVILAAALTFMVISVIMENRMVMKSDIKR
ncbi:MAG: hypothetical protein K2I03_09920 [Lachnospiraceae bacterium]|nr:hypothetical protein [Lachnospiraceae bacterium]MDE6232780.1 hypothetical protein [Lachnospiraceae bacterium]MDE6251089.1 hypothetical protein [Lachnospiraceae bacterium]